MLQFKTSNNQPVSQSFNLKNAGNIDMKLLLGVIEFQDHFTMDPSQLTIQPGRETTVTASFLPTCDLNVDAIETYVQL
jgi:centrosomal protein CEP192